MGKDRDGVLQFPQVDRPDDSALDKFTTDARDTEIERVANTFQATLLGYGRWVISGIDDNNQLVVLGAVSGTTLIEALGMVGAGG
jgi:hypothetical protein